jgi:hypothetical protein
MFHFTSMTYDVQCVPDALSQAAEPSDYERAFADALAAERVPEPEEDQRLQEGDGIQGFQQAGEGPGQVQAQPGPEDPEPVKPEELHIPERELAEATREALPDLPFDAELSNAFNGASSTRKRVHTAPLSTMVENIQKGNQVLSSIVDQLRQINADIRSVPPE